MTSKLLNKITAAFLGQSQELNPDEKLSSLLRIFGLKGDKLGIHGIKPSVAMFDHLRTAATQATPFKVVKMVDDLNALKDVKRDSPQTITVARLTSPYEGLQGVELIDPGDAVELKRRAAEVVTPILLWLERNPAALEYVDIFEVANEPDPPATPDEINAHSGALPVPARRGYGNLGRIFAAAIDLIRARYPDLGIGIGSFNAGTPEYPEMVAFVQSGVMRKGYDDGRVFLCYHEGVFNEDPIDQGFGEPLPNCDFVLSDGGQMVGRIAYFAAAAGGNMIPAICTEFYPGGDRSPENVRSRLAWVDEWASRQWWLWAILPFTHAPSGGWQNSDLTNAYPAILSYMLTVKDRENAQPEDPPDPPGGGGDPTVVTLFDEWFDTKDDDDWFDVIFNNEPYQQVRNEWSPFTRLGNNPLSGDPWNKFAPNKCRFMWDAYIPEPERPRYLNARGHVYKIWSASQAQNFTLIAPEVTAPAGTMTIQIVYNDDCYVAITNGQKVPPGDPLSYECRVGFSRITAAIPDRGERAWDESGVEHIVKSDWHLSQFQQDNVVELTFDLEDEQVGRVWVEFRARWAISHAAAFVKRFSAVVVTESDPPDPPGDPCEHLRPRVDYARTYVLLPPGLTKEWGRAAVEATWEDGRTVGRSADDAGFGQGLLSSRRVILVNPRQWGRGDNGETIEEWFALYYPGAILDPVEAATPDELYRLLSGEDPPDPPTTPSPVYDVHFGLHASADPAFGPSDLAIITAAKPRALKFLTTHSPQDIQASLTRLGSAPRTVVVRIFQSWGGRAITPEQFVAWNLPDIKRTRSAIPLTFVVYWEVHNEPNLYEEGFGFSWQSGGEFGAWFEQVVALLRSNVPATDRFIFPGLSPGGFVPGVRFDEEEFLTGAAATMRRAQGIGIHAYWSKNAPLSLAIDHVKKYATRFPNSQILITEVAENSKNSQGVSPEIKADQYVEFWSKCKKIKNILSLFIFVVSASDPIWGWSDPNATGQVLTLPMGQIMGARDEGGSNV